MVKNIQNSKKIVLKYLSTIEFADYSDLLVIDQDIIHKQRTCLVIKETKTVWISEVPVKVRINPKHESMKRREWTVLY